MMGKYALTEQERKWLEKRKNLCTRCKRYSPFTKYCHCKMNFKTDAYSLIPDGMDAAEFEARCKVKMANKPIKSKPCAYGKCPRDYKTCPFFEMQGDLSLPFCRLLCVHIAVEQEMDHDTV